MPRGPPGAGGRRSTSGIMAVVVLVCIIMGTSIMVAGGIWLIWDTATFSTVNNPWGNPDWRFCSPWFFACVDNAHWTLPIDAGATLAIAAYVIAIPCAIVLGYLLRPAASRIGG